VSAAGPRAGTVLAFSGGVGGAKLVLGLSRVVAAEELCVVANTGDDFEHLGVHVSPDLDTVMYTLAGLANPETGWGLAGESWEFLAALERLGGETWFRLGDRDLATHVERTRRLAAGETLSQVTVALCAALGVAPRLFPMTDDKVRTQILSGADRLEFQEYFVRDRCEPVVSGFVFTGIQEAFPSPGLRGALEETGLRAMILCPSNPFVSVDPLLALRGVAEAMRASAAPIVAVTPIVGGRALKGPAAKMMAELGLEVSPLSVARHYRERELLDGFVLDLRDEKAAPAIEALGVAVRVTDTVMVSLADRERLAAESLDLAASLV